MNVAVGGWPTGAGPETSTPTGEAAEWRATDRGLVGVPLGQGLAPARLRHFAAPIERGSASALAPGRRGRALGTLALHPSTVFR